MNLGVIELGCVSANYVTRSESWLAAYNRFERASRDWGRNDDTGPNHSWLRSKIARCGGFLSWWWGCGGGTIFPARKWTMKACLHAASTKIRLKFPVNGNIIGPRTFPRSHQGQVFAGLAGCGRTLLADTHRWEIDLCKSLSTNLKSSEILS